MAKCEVCGQSIGLFGTGRYWGTKDGKKTCSEAHWEQYNKSLLYKNSNNNNSNNRNSNEEEKEDKSGWFNF